MILRELFTEAAGTNAWKKVGNNTVRKYRCTYGPRKGRVMSSPSACNAPINVKRSMQLKKNKAKIGKTGQVKIKRTKTFNPASRRLRKLHK